MDFDWEIIKIYNDENRRGVKVRYIPLDDRCSDIELEVNVPWHKCDDAEHAKEVCKDKVVAYAPRRAWEKQLNATDDHSQQIVEELKNDRIEGSVREAHTARSEGDSDVSGPG